MNPVRGVSTGQERLNLDEKTLADAFKAAGYATGAFGKWHNGSQWPYHPNARGFDEYFDVAAAGVELDKAHAFLDETARDEALATEVGGQRMIQAIHLARGGRFAITSAISRPHIRWIPRCNLALMFHALCRWGMSGRSRWAMAMCAPTTA